MLSTSNSRFALAPVAQAGASPAHYAAYMQSKDLSAPATIAADELQEDDTGPHAKLDDANLDRDWEAVVFL
jgi:hypothetical protein